MADDHVNLKNCKKFTYKEIQDKVAQRWQIHNYYEVLMECAVHEDESGVYINLQHPSWKKLIDLVQKYSTKKRKKRRSASQPTVKLESTSREPVLSGVSNASAPSDPRASSFASEPMPSNLRTPSNNDSDLGNLSVNLGGNQSDKNGSANSDVIPVRRAKRQRQKVKTRREWTELLNELLDDRQPENPSKQIKLVRQCCTAIGIPPDRRGDVWRILLGLNKKHRPHEPLPDAPGPALHNQKTINLDVERTRPNISPFHEPEVRKSMEIILTEYCRRRHLSYVQGMNYVLCPFYLLGLNDNNEIYRLYDAFLRIYLPNTFTDSEFGALQCIFRLFKIALQYHDPELSMYLDQHEIPPEIYASEWFMTIYGQKCPIDVLLLIWDDLLLNPDPRFHYFVSLELLRGQKQQLLDCNVEEMPEYLSTITIQDKDQARRLFLQAKKTSSVTPNTYHDLLHKCTVQKVVVDGALYTELDGLQSMPIEPRELIDYCYTDATEKKKDGKRRRRDSVRRKQNKIKYFVIDCRPLEQYEAGHLPVAFHLSPALTPDKMREKLDGFLAMRGSAFCLFFDGVPSKRRDMLATSCLLFFLNKRVKYVSICRGGYCGVHQLLGQDPENDFVDHDPSRCLECNGNKKIGGLSYMAKKLGNFADSLKRTGARSDTAIPKSVKMLSGTVAAMLTMTLMRDKTTPNVLFHKAADRLLAVMVAEALEKANISQNQVESCSHQPFDGVQTVKSIYGVALDRQAEHCLREALDVYRPVARTLVGELRIEEKFTQDEKGAHHNVRSAVAYTPGDIEDRMVFIFAPILTSKHDIHSAVEALLQLGARDLTVLTFVASRPALWVLCDKYSNYDVRVICAAVDTLVKGRISPGLGNFGQRYRVPLQVTSQTTIESNVEAGSEQKLRTPPKEANPDPIETPEKNSPPLTKNLDPTPEEVDAALKKDPKPEEVGSEKASPLVGSEKASPPDAGEADLSMLLEEDQKDDPGDPIQ